MLRCARLPVLLAAVLASLLLCAPASAATGKPVLLAPTPSSASASPLIVRFTLPEAAAAGTVEVIFAQTGTTVTLSSLEDSAGEHTVSLSTQDLTANKDEVASASEANLPDGTYTVTLAYQNVAREPVSAASATNVRIDTVTAPPQLTGPLSGEAVEGPFTATYVLPEEALAGSVALVLEGEETGTSTIVLADTEKGEHSVTVNPAHPASEAGVQSAPLKLAPGPYKVHVSYQDALANAIAESSPIPLTLLAKECSPGAYSESGRQPCQKCPAGSFAAAGGSSVCVPAEPGHYVATDGATEDLECPAGSYNEITGQTSCRIVPAGHYATAGSAFAIPCLPGTNAPGERGTSAAACLVDPPGSFSNQGAASATLCRPGTFAAQSDTFECAVAEAGFYVEGEGATMELACPAGSFSPFEQDSQCVAAPAGTYAAEGATAPTACPAGTEAPAPRSASCTAVAKLPSAIVTPSILPVAPATATPQPALKCTLSAAGGQISLRRTAEQAYELTCNLGAQLSVRAGVRITSGHRHLQLTAPTANLTAVAGVLSKQLIHVKLTKAARGLLSSRRARVKLAISVSTSSAGATAEPVTSASLPGAG